MNLNDCINRLPIMLRGRFSSSNNASWLAWASDGISKIERVSVGPGQKRTALGWQMGSGFIPKPAGLFQITDAFLDGEQVSVKGKDSRGFPMAASFVTFKRVPVAVKSDGMSITLDIESLSGEFPNHRKVTVLNYNGPSRSGSFTVESGDPVPTAANALAGWVIWINGEQLHISESSQTLAITTFKTSTTSDQVLSGAIPGQDLAGVMENALAGCEVHSGNDILPIQSSTWIVPQQVPSGWTSTLNFSCELAEPCRSFDAKPGHILQSNLVIHGYKALPRPVNLTEELDLPQGCEGLLASYLKWSAENDQDSSSPDAKVAAAAFDQALKTYAIDQGRTNGASRVTSYRFTPTSAKVW